MLCRIGKISGLTLVLFLSLFCVFFLLSGVCFSLFEMILPVLMQTAKLNLALFIECLIFNSHFLKSILR